ncbi:hypothetical protein UFOVP699_184 [uncultured Caudovirales phage]|uniref:Uncharacterized protein n=1 Tax=uncultured Caudovirales phage TaxID=2100421 RepID=A0A6J5NQT8_9CAUD|nr:hypothetical protein UFOVP699_184 [uncultured Caudovirales phage]
MSYLLSYKGWRALHEAEESGEKQKSLVLLSGPSASGKTYFAMNRLGAKHWYSDPTAKTVLLGTDNFNNQEIRPTFIKLVEDSGMPTLAKIASQVDSPHILKLYDTEFAQWSKEASPEEKSRYEELERVAGYDPEKCKSTVRKQEGKDGDGRVSAMSWAAHLLPATEILFDDVGDAIKNYYAEGEVKDILLFTPLDHYLGNIISRNESSNKGERIDTSNKEAGIYQYCDWYRAAAEPDLDDKKYSVEEMKSQLEAAGYSNSDELLQLLGVTPELEEGFYIGLKDWVTPTRIINSRDESTGRAESAANFDSFSAL